MVGIIQCFFETLGADFKKVQCLVEKVGLVFKVAQICFSEFMIEEKQFLKVRAVCHLCDKVSCTEHFAEQFNFC